MRERERGEGKLLRNNSFIFSLNRGKNLPNNNEIYPQQSSSSVLRLGVATNQAKNRKPLCQRKGPRVSKVCEEGEGVAKVVL